MDVLKSPEYHGSRACLNAYLNIGFVLRLSDFDIGSKPVDDLIDDLRVRDEINTLRRIRVHVRHGGGEITVADPVFISLDIFDRGRRFVGKDHVGDMIQTVEYHIPPVFVVPHEIIALVVQDHLIRADALFGAFVKLLVEAEFVVVVTDLFSPLDPFADGLYVIKHSRVGCFALIIDGVDMLDAGFEILA